MNTPASNPYEKRKGYAWHKTIGIALVGAALAAALYSRTPPPVEPRSIHEVAGVVYSTLYDVKIVVGAISDDERARLRRVVEEALAFVDERMSCHRSGSEIDRLNHAPAGQWLPVSAETAQVLRLSRETSAWSGGAFDITVGPLVRLWGFHDKKTLTAEPPAAEVERLRGAIGWAKVEVGGDGKSARRLNEDVLVDLSAIAKGYGVDLVSRRLAEAGYREHMVEVGGEVQARGRNARREPWRIAVQNPASEEGDVLDVLALEDIAVATSGDYRNYYELDGKRLSHTINPRTGRPLDHRLASITVLHDSCAVADAYATALNVLGPKEGRVLAEKSSLAALFLVRNEAGGFTAEATPALSRYRIKVPKKEVP